VGLGVKVRLFGADVFLGTKFVNVGRCVRVAVADGVNGMEVSVRVGVRLNVGAETISENATTVSAMTVLILATKKSTTPTAGVPAWAAWLISLTPTAAAPHNRLTPRRAAKTIHKSGRYSLGLTTKVSTSRTLSPKPMNLSSTVTKQLIDYWYPNRLVYLIMPQISGNFRLKWFVFLSFGVYRFPQSICYETRSFPAG